MRDEAVPESERRRRRVQGPAAPRERMAQASGPVKAATSAVPPLERRAGAPSPGQPSRRMEPWAWTQAERRAWAEPKAATSGQAEAPVPRARPKPAEEQGWPAEAAALGTPTVRAGVSRRQARVPSRSPAPPPHAAPG
ncbi:MAG TPA: hypothetical protein VH700_04915 [Gemmatimonadales bacterium]